jgi:hypothetical protein
MEETISSASTVNHYLQEKQQGLLPALPSGKPSPNQIHSCKKTHKSAGDRPSTALKSLLVSNFLSTKTQRRRGRRGEIRAINDHTPTSTDL